MPVTELPLRYLGGKTKIYNKVKETLDSVLTCQGRVYIELYGGGILTFEPGEMRKIRIPMQMVEQLDLSKIDCWQRNGEID